MNSAMLWVNRILLSLAVLAMYTAIEHKEYAFATGVGVGALLLLIEYAVDYYVYRTEKGR